MSSAIAKLLTLGSPSLMPDFFPFEPPELVDGGPIARELLSMLAQRNGFYAFESALHVFPLAVDRAKQSLLWWNDATIWRNEFGTLLSDSVLYFAQDAFGNQFGLCDRGVVQLFPESASEQPFAKTLEEWAEVLLEDWRLHTGWKLAHEWQANYRKLASNERLYPKLPFVVGGKYEVDNLFAGDMVERMRFHGHFAQQIAALPDGSQITLRIVE